MNTIRQRHEDLEEGLFDTRDMMENNWGQIPDDRKARCERRRTWREQPLRRGGRCRKEQYENKHAGGQSGQ